MILLLLRAYQILVSPLFAGSCRYWPSCSEYTREAVQVHGVIRGGWFGFRRLARCHPFGGSGYDPVSGPPARHQPIAANGARRRV